MNTKTEQEMIEDMKSMELDEKQIKSFFYKILIIKKMMLLKLL